MKKTIIEQQILTSFSNPETSLPMMSRRTFVKTVAGSLVTIKFFSLASNVAQAAGSSVSNEFSNNEPYLNNEAWMGSPGSANYRIDGWAKVTGKKVYARDYHAKDMQAWPDTESPVMIIRAINVEQVFEDLDLSLLPAEYQPDNILYGETVKNKIKLVNTISKDHHLDQVIDKLRDQISFTTTETDEGVVLPDDFLWPFIVPKKQLAEFYGQPVAFLTFKDRKTYLGAKKIIQFNDAFQVYGEIAQPVVEKPLPPVTNYVRVAGEDNKDVFSYAKDHADKNYDSNANQYRLKIEESIAKNVKTGQWKSFQDEFSMQAMDPMFMEPESGIAYYESATKTLNIVVGTQSPDGDVKTLLTMFDSADASIKISNVNLYSCYPGGGFGGRDSSLFTLNLGIAAVFSKDKVVRIAYDRFEQFQSGLKRHACKGKEQLAFDSDGNIQALINSMEFDSGGRRNLSPYVAQLAGACAGGSYDIAKSAIHSEANYSTNVSGGSQRGFGGPQAYFIIESLFDEAAVDLGLDPFQIRQNNILATGDKTVIGGPINQSLQLEKILELAKQDPIWQQREKDAKQWQEQGLKYGVGFAMSNQAYGTSGDGVLAEIKIDPSGKFIVSTNAVDMGNGSATTLAVVIADFVGANASHIEMGNAELWPMLKMKTGRTYKGPDGCSTWDCPNWTPKGVGSSSACLTGFHQVHAARQAAKILFDVALLPAALAIWGKTEKQITVEKVYWNKGVLELKDTTLPGLTLQQIADYLHNNKGITGVLAHAWFQEFWAKASFTINNKSQQWDVDSLAVSYGDSHDIQPIYRDKVEKTPIQASGYVRTEFAPCGNLIGVTVDPTTGDVKVRRSASFLNAGKVITEGFVSGQSQGGVAMATGYTLLEDMPPGKTGPANGKWNLNRYFVAKSKDVALTEQRLITLEPEAGQTTSRGIAEAVMCSVAPAISNAIYAAINKRLRHLPITSAKVREAMNGKN